MLRLIVNVPPSGIVHGCSAGIIRELHAVNADFVDCGLKILELESSKRVSRCRLNMAVNKWCGDPLGLSETGLLVETEESESR